MCSVVTDDEKLCVNYIYITKKRIVVIAAERPRRAALENRTLEKIKMERN